MKKDRLDGVLEMMDYIYKHYESELCTEKALFEMFGEEKCKDFERYAMGGSQPYAATSVISKKKYDVVTGQEYTDDQQIIVLTQKGVRTVYRLRDSRGRKSTSDKIQMTQIHINALLLGAVFILAIASSWAFLRDLIQNREQMTFIGLGLTTAMAVGLVYIGMISRNLHE